MSAFRVGQAVQVMVADIATGVGRVTSATVQLVDGESLQVAIGGTTRPMPACELRDHRDRCRQSVIWDARAAARAGR